jgi:uncharacterized protein (UPF0332 family)
MNFDWLDYIYLAESLLDSHNEAQLRTSASRAYYGLYGFARIKKGLQFIKGNDIHIQVINAYRDSKDKNEKKIGRILFQLRKSRMNADYHANISFSKNPDKTASLVRKAKDALKILGII